MKSKSSKKAYTIVVHYPSDENQILELRRRMGNAYVRFVKDYISNLPIDSSEIKNELFSEIVDTLIEKQ